MDSETMNSSKKLRKGRGILRIVLGWLLILINLLIWLGAWLTARVPRNLIDLEDRLYLLFLSSLLLFGLFLIFGGVKARLKQGRVLNLLRALQLVCLGALLPGIGMMALHESGTIDVEAVKDSVVMIRTYDQDGMEIGQGSGFCSFGEDLIVTNFHVVDGAWRIEVLADDGRSVDAAEILIFDKEGDLALLSGDFNLSPLKRGSSWSLGPEERLTTIGSPEGAFNTVDGEAKVADLYWDSLVFEGAAAPGASGGAVFDRHGEAVGVLTAIIDEEKQINQAAAIEGVEGLYQAYRAQEYQLLTAGDERIQSMTPDIFDEAGGGELEIVIDYGDGPWRTDSMETFYILTGNQSIFARILQPGSPTLLRYPDLGAISAFYEGLTVEEQKLAADFYRQLRSYDAWYFSEENEYKALIENLRKDDPKLWDEHQLILDGRILTRVEYAVFLAAIDSATDWKSFDNAVESMPVGAEKGNILRLLFSDMPVSALSKSERSAMTALIEGSSYDPDPTRDAAVRAALLARLGL